jgi:hypothetical protein
LKLIMWQLKDDRRMVQYEGFHVFKVRRKILFFFHDVPTVLTKRLADLRRKSQQVLRSPEIPHHEQTAPSQVLAQFPRRPDRRRPVQ